MTRLKVLVVDDEPLARETLATLVERAAGFELVGECSDGLEARRRIAVARPDVVLLDIEMPGLRGIDLVAELPGEERPAVVFVTAHDEHAVRAFELEAADYLLKPFSDARFDEVLGRVQRRVLEQRMATLATELARGGTAVAPEPPRHLERIAVARQGRKILVPVGELLWIESDDYCVRLHTAKGSYLTRDSLASLEERLDPAAFVRVHRGAIVRIDAVTSIRTRPNGGRWLELAGGERVPVSRSRTKAALARLDPGLTDERPPS